MADSVREGVFVSLPQRVGGGVTAGSCVRARGRALVSKLT